MKHSLPTLLLSLLSLSPVLSAELSPLKTDFSKADEKNWQLKRMVPAAPSLVFSLSKESPGLRFTSEGFDLLTREWRVGTAPFEMSADLAISKGRAEVFNRARGVVLSLSSAPVDQMKAEDLAVIVAVTQTGAIATIKQGAARYGVEKRPGNWHFGGQEVGEKFATSMGGTGGQDFSVRWPTKLLDGIKLRFWASRAADGKVRFKIYHADGAAAPWWEGEVVLPANLQAVPLQLLTVQTGREAMDFQDLSKFSLAVGQGSGPLDGTLTELQARFLDADGKTELDRSFPAAVMASAPNWKPGSNLLNQEQLAALRKKFNDPAFASYKTMILRTATPEWMATLKMGQPDQNEALIALTWAYLLTGDKAAYWDRLLTHINALIGPSEIYPANVYEFPGRMRQNLYIREFWIQNMAALAITYDLLGEELDRARQERIRFLLVRAMKSYHLMLDDGDWWFGENPSNTIGVGNGCMGIIAVVLQKEQPELATRTIDRALTNIRKLFLGVDPDGGCLEGAMYWNYGLGYPMLLGWALQQTTGNDEGLLTSPQVSNATKYLAINFGGDDKMIPFNDTQPWLVGWPVLAAAGMTSNDPLARWMADHLAETYAAGNPAPEQARSSYTVPAFLYRDEIPSPKVFPGLPNIATLNSVQEGVMRSNGEDLIPTLLTGVKGKGERSTHHANQDQGSFVLYADGEMVLLDPGYFENTAQKHSLPLIGDAEKMLLHATALCPISNAWESGNLRSMTVDSTAAYNAGKNEANPLAERVRRVFLQVGDHALIVLDDVLPKEKSAPITAQYQAGVPVTATGSSAFLQTKSGGVCLQTFGPQLSFKSVPRTFSKDWIYKKSGVPWTTLLAEYPANAAKPLLTVLLRTNAKETKADVVYSGDAISVTIPDLGTFRFIPSSSGWTTNQPIKL